MTDLQALKIAQDFKKLAQELLAADSDTLLEITYDQFSYLLEYIPDESEAVYLLVAVVLHTVASDNKLSGAETRFLAEFTKKTENEVEELVVSVAKGERYRNLDLSPYPFEVKRRLAVISMAVAALDKEYSFEERSFVLDEILFS